MKYSITVRVIIGLPALLVLAIFCYFLLIANQNRFAFALIRTGRNFLDPYGMTPAQVKEFFERVEPEKDYFDKAKPEFKMETISICDEQLIIKKRPEENIDLNKKTKRKIDKSNTRPMDVAREAILDANIDISEETDTSIIFIWKGSRVTLFPYSGWHSGKTITDGRGLDNLLKQLK